MARRVHLHIGTMKSATTYLQDLCELNPDRLAQAGVLWPVGISRYAGIRAFLGRAEPQTDPPGAWRTLNRRIRAHPDDVVLSNELLAGVESKRVGRLVEALSPAEVFVVVTARDPVRVIPSAWQTAIRNGEKTFSWTEFSSSVCYDPPEDGEGDPRAAAIRDRFWHHHDLAALLRRWQEFVPDERITLVTVPPPGGDREAVARRFGAAIGVDLTGLPQPRSRGNTTLGAHSAELIRRVNLAMTGADRAARKYGIRSALADSALSALAGAEPEFGLPPELHAWAVERARRMVDELRPMTVHVEGDLADLIPVTAPATELVDPGASSDAQLLEVAVHGLIGATGHAARLRLRNNELRSQLEKLQSGREISRAPADQRRPPRARLLLRRVPSRLRRILRS